MLRFSARLFLIVALLAGWQAALLHPIKHVDSAGNLVHSSGGDSRQSGSLLCDALAALTACAPGATSPVFATAPPADLSPPPQANAPRIAEAPPFLSQGPPASV
jgi:hypothetical protein